MAKPSRSSPRSASKHSKQNGGTFLGIVLGLIVGLAIAVVVALYITRAPTPFVEKVVPPPGASGTGAVEQQYDPNRALQGKSPGQPVPQTAQAAPPNTAPGQSAAPATNPNPPSGMLEEPQIVEVPPSGASTPANGVNGVNGAAAPQAQANGNAPASRPPLLANVPPEGNAAAPRANNVPGTASPNSANMEANAAAYFLQVGSYKTPADAEQQRARLAFQGFESKVTQRAAGGTTYYRVRIGPFAKFDDMNVIRQRLSEAGIDTAVIPPKQ
jgi:cell division protein FtsN